MLRQNITDGESCPRCAKRGAQSVIKICNASLKFCSNSNCLYPLDLDNSDQPSRSSEVNENVIEEISDDSNPTSVERNVFAIFKRQELVSQKKNAANDPGAIEVIDETGVDVILLGDSNFNHQATEVNSDDSVEEMFTEIVDIEKSEQDQNFSGSTQDPVESISDNVRSVKKKRVLNRDNSVEEMFTEIEDVEKVVKNKEDAVGSSQDQVKCISDTVRSVKKKRALTSFDSIEEMFTKIAYVEKAKNNKEDAVGRSQDIIDCVSDTVRSVEGEDSDDGIEEIFTEITDVEKVEKDHEVSVASSQDLFQCISDSVQCMEDKRTSNGDDEEIVAELEDVQKSGLDEEDTGGSNQDCVENGNCPSGNQNENEDVLVDLTLSQSQELRSEDGTCNATFDEGCEMLQKILNMCVSDEEDSTCESLEPNSSTTSENSSTMSLSESHPICPQWKNKNNMCWLDTTLSLLLMSPLRSLVLKTLKGKSASLKDRRGSSMWLDSLLQDTFKEYQKVMRRVVRLQSVVNSPQLGDAAKLSYRRVKARLERIRMHLLEYLQEHCNVGHDESGDSPVFALSGLLKKKSSMRPLFDSATKYHMQCSECRFLCCISRENPIVCLVKQPPSDFVFTKEGFTLQNEACESCQEGDQTRRVRWARLNHFLLVQFCHGLSDERSADEWCERLTFEAKGAKYTPVGAVQYKTLSRKTKHFVAWIRAQDNSAWLEADDMNQRFCLFDKRSLGFPASELHLLLFMARPAGAEAGAEAEAETEDGPRFPLCFESATEVVWPSPAFVRIKSDPMRLAVGSASSSKKNTKPEPVAEESEAEQAEEAEVEERHRGSSGVSFASIASEHACLRPRSKRKSSTPKSKGVCLKRARISLRRCDDF